MVVQAEPRPRARAASMKLQTAGSTEPKNDACTIGGRPSVRPSWHGTTWTGTSAMWSARWPAERPMRAAWRRLAGSVGRDGGVPRMPSSR